jgi:hypothetical protein
VNYSYKFSIGGVVILAIGKNCPALDIVETYRPFAVASGNPNVTLRLHYGRLPKVKLGRCVFTTDTWQIHLVNKGFAISLHSPAFTPNLYGLTVLENDIRTGEVYFSTYPDRFPVYPLESPLDQVLMICLLSQRNGLMIHACGIADNGIGYLFAGNSSHGKTTMAKLWKNDATILNDDRIVIRHKENRFWMYGTPWHGEYTGVSAKGVPIEKIFFLKHSESNSVEKINGAVASSMVLARSFPPLWDAEGMRFTLDFCSQLVSAVPCYKLDFVPDSSIVDFIRCVK